MCPCPICAFILLILSPFIGYKLAKKKAKQHHECCQLCQKIEKKKGKK